MINGDHNLAAQILTSLSKNSSAAIEEKLDKIVAVDPLMDKVVSLAKRIRSKIIKNTWPSQSATKIESELEDLIQLLRAESSSMAEWLIIEAVATNFVKMCSAEDLRIMALQKPLPHATAEYWAKCVDYAQKAYFRSIVSLCQIRKLAVRTPQLQLNIANQQLNVMSKTGEPEADGRA